MATFPTDVTNFSRKPDRDYKYNSMFRSTNWETESGYEKRRLISRKIVRTFEFTYTNISLNEKNGLEQFYHARFGEFEAFDMPMSYIQTGSSETVRVRFDGELQISNPFVNVFTITVKLKETTD